MFVYKEAELLQNLIVPKLTVILDSFQQAITYLNGNKNNAFNVFKANSIDNRMK